MDWSALAAPAVSLLGGFFGQSSARDSAEKAARMQFEYQKALNEQQNAFNVENYMNRYRWARADMRAAGLNPILAATSGIGGSIAGASAGQASLAVPQTPDFGSMLGSSLSSAYQTSSQKEIAKMQNRVALKELDLKEKDINSAIDKRVADTLRDNMMANTKKWAIEEENSRAWLKNSAEIENLKETIRIQEEHFIRSDAAAATSASAHVLAAEAAWNNSEVQSRLADLAEKTGYTQQELNLAHKIYFETLTGDAESLKEWHDYLNDHKEIRGAVGLIDSLWDTFSKGAKAHTLMNMID